MNVFIVCINFVSPHKFVQLVHFVEHMRISVHGISVANRMNQLPNAPNACQILFVQFSFSLLGHD